MPLPRHPAPAAPHEQPDDPADEPANNDPADSDAEALYAWQTRPSKTQLKKDSHELQALGEAVVNLPASRLDGLAIPENLRDAIAEFKRTRSHEGKRRQMQYIGKLMRKTDPAPLREAVAAMQLGRAKDALALHEAEHWRVVLLAGDDAVGDWLQRYPDTDLQQLRSLVRAARKDAAAAPEQRSGRAYRELFRFIRQHQSDGSAEDGAQDAGSEHDGND